MKNNLKSSSKTLYAVCICIVVLMVICYFGTSTTKGTYSAPVYTCPSGYTNYNQNNMYCYRCEEGGTLTGTGIGDDVMCLYGTKEVKCTSNKDGDACEQYREKGYTCVLSSGNSQAATYTCVFENYRYYPDKVAITVQQLSCYICLGTSGSISSGGSYKWLASPEPNCHKSATCAGTPSPKKYECTLTDNSKVCVTAYDSAWAGASVSETGTSCKEVSSCSTSGGGGNTPSNPSTPSSTPSSSPSSSTPSSSSNVDENPKTGSVAIFLVWIIALGTLVYAGVYFKQVRENN